MTLFDAISQILTQAGEPLHYREITERIIAQGLWSSAGQTPAASVSAVLASQLKQHGEDAVFVRPAPGLYALRSASVVHGSPVYVPTVPVTSEQPETLEAEPLSFNDAAALILEQCDNGMPMHYKTLTDQALALGLIQTKGQTPAATMNAQLTTEIAKAINRGEVPRFVQHGHGMYGLSAWQPKGILQEIAVHNAAVRQQLRKSVQAMDPTNFEILVGDLLRSLGFNDVIVTKKSGDGGVDVRGVLVECGGIIRMPYAVQAKKWKANVQAPDVQGLRGSLAAEEHGLFITTSDYSLGAYAEASAPGKRPITLMNGQQLLGLLIEYNFGVSNTPYRLLELGDMSKITPTG